MTKGDKDDSDPNYDERTANEPSQDGTDIQPEQGTVFSRMTNMTETNSSEGLNPAGRNVITRYGSKDLKSLLRSWTTPDIQSFPKESATSIAKSSLREGGMTRTLLGAGDAIKGSIQRIARSIGTENDVEKSQKPKDD
ncbi:uncharacterized protein I303_103976 [Kwoniella dejecticola CBS 10117]|uniref:Uncharacterized protein n=1 Tax=Kwoniella dejecticola CBS 10117 TaxID=1296121 RepID=A0A1A6A892_9TREE|nr:uncharacterized protein I303_03993 [Kwoniella dejecticola CBS 10117]OBR86271.1 hypothetical protein I303_03993 [Kwoniella dejecticola CBS 10117]